jgi:uncharacterized protein (TIGR03118 family)
VANNGTATATVYDGDGTPQPVAAPLVVTIPGAAEPAPTGMVFNGSDAFRVTAGAASGPSRFIFVSEDGTIAGWNPDVDPTNAIVASTVPGAVYTGAAIGAGVGSGPLLYVANFGAGTVDVFDASFLPVDFAANAFVDPGLPAGYAPFGIRVVGDRVWVAYAQKDDSGEEVAGPGKGYVDVYGADGDYERRFASAGALDAPWGIAIAPDEFGDFGGAVMIGNFGNGQINAFDRENGQRLGALEDAQGQPLQIEGLWAIEFGNDAMAGDADELYFTAGIEDETHGLFGEIAATRRQDP